MIISLIIAVLGFVGACCTYQLGKWAERALWTDWADNDPDGWPDHLNEIDLEPLLHAPTPKSRRIMAFNSGFEQGEMEATRRHATARQSFYSGESIEVPEQAAS